MNNAQKKRIGILGAGTWGRAISLFWAKMGYEVYLWSFEFSVSSSLLNGVSLNNLFFGSIIPDSINITGKIEDVFINADTIFDCIPNMYLRDTISNGLPFFDRDRHRFISTSRGLELDTGMFSFEIIQEMFHPKFPTLLFCGPTDPKDIALNNFCNALIASDDQSTIDNFVKEIKGISNIKFLQINDILAGSIICSFRGLLNFCAGLLNKNDFSMKKKLHFIGLCLKELSDLIKATKSTVDSTTILFCLGDLELIHSYSEVKSFQAGTICGSKISLQEVRQGLYSLTEGVSTVISIISYAKSKGVSMPFCERIEQYLMLGCQSSQLPDQEDLCEPVVNSNNLFSQEFI